MSEETEEQIAKRSRKLSAEVYLRMVPVAIACFLIIFIFLPWSLYTRDVKEITKEAHERAEIVRHGLLAVMMATGDPQEVRAAVDGFKVAGDFTFRMARSKYVRHQFGDRDGEIPRDDIEKAVLEGTREEYSELEGTNFREVLPFHADTRCGRCHVDLEGNPIKPGTVMGIAVFTTNVSDKRDYSLRLIISVATVAGLAFAAFFAMFMGVFNRTVLTPLGRLTEDIARIEKENFDLTFHDPDTKEMEILVSQVKRTASSLKEIKENREQQLERERKLTQEVRLFAKEQAGIHGISNEQDIKEIVDRFSTAIKHRHTAEMVEAIVPYVQEESKLLEIPNNTDLVHSAVLFLTNIIPDTHEKIKRRSVELAVEEALTNAIVHGNLEVSSKLKDEDFEAFNNEVYRRSSLVPYSKRKVTVRYHYDNRRAVYTIADQGPGFKWREYMDRSHEDVLLEVHGRGIIIMRAFASSISFNKTGNEVTMVFEF